MKSVSFNPAIAELKTLMALFGNQANIAELLVVNKSSVNRWLHEELVPDPENEEKIAALRYLTTRLSKIFKPEVAREWLLGVNALLGNQRPIDLLKHGRITEVLSAIEQTEAGSYV